VIMCESPVSPQTFVMQTVGVSHISQLCMTAMVMSYAVIRSNHGMMLAQASFTSRMGDEHGIERRKLYAALAIGVIVAIIVAVVTTFILAHEVGAFNFQSHAFTKGHIEAYAALAEKSDAKQGPDFVRMGFFGGGMALMWTILMIRTRMPGFWLHPVGLTFTSTSVYGLMTINFFIAWLLKATFTRVGGLRMVNRAKPFFLGLICGHAIGVAYGVIIDATFFYGQGHRILTGW
jgi:uncharacterized protein DUF6784